MFLQVLEKIWRIQWQRFSSKYIKDYSFNVDSQSEDSIHVISTCDSCSYIIKIAFLCS